VLDIADNLQRALDAVPAEAKAAADPGLKALIEGVELTERSLLNTLEKNGVRKFDPSARNSIRISSRRCTRFPILRTGGHVVQVVQAGYMIGERVLRPALVGLSKGGRKNRPGGALQSRRRIIIRGYAPSIPYPEVRAYEPRRMGHGPCSSFEARKSAHLRMTGGRAVDPRTSLKPQSLRLDALDAALAISAQAWRATLRIDAAAGVFDT